MTMDNEFIELMEKKNMGTVKNCAMNFVEKNYERERQINVNVSLSFLEKRIWKSNVVDPLLGFN